MDVPVMHVNLLNVIIAIYVIGYQITICTDWSWIPMDKKDYELPYKEKWKAIQQNF
ncbi:hypothetical protein [Prochlorococcus marinus]|uniref:hypothetical protein n=1 Tax=Prochlorococcus marinus TaxID=1219 RepID=UPI0022B37CB7|nr:hypothetical protein [Prochlorococcus marinus]